MLKHLVIALLVLASCGEKEPVSADGAGAEDAAVIVVVTVGGARLQPVVAPEATHLWPLASGWSLKVTRLAESYPAEVAAEFTGPLDGTFRVEPFAGVPTSFHLELRDDTNTLQARATTSAAIFDQTEADRLVSAFLLPLDAVVSAVDDKGAIATVKGLLGRSVTAMGTGEVLLVGGSVYAGGMPCGEGAAGAPSSIIQRFDPANGGLQPLSKLNKARSFHVAVPLSTVRLAVLGGYVQGSSGGLEPTSSVELIRLDAGVVQQAPHGLSTGRARACAVAVGGRLVIAGGVGPQAASVEVWDPAIGPIGKPTSLPSWRRDAGCATAVDPANERNLFFLVGGATSSGLAVDVLPFEVGDAGLVPFAPIGLPDGGLSGAFVHAPLGALALVLAGGFGSGGTARGKTWVNLLASVAGGWKPLPALSEARGCAASAIIAQGSLALLLGGMGAAGEPLASLDLVVLDGSSGVTTTATLPGPQAGSAAVRLEDGSVLLAGGVRMDGAKIVAADGLWRYLPADVQ